MGEKFKFANMMPNAWFYKLRDMGKGKKQSNVQSKKKKKQPPSSTVQQSNSKPLYPQQRKSYYFTRQLTSDDDKFHNSPENPPEFSDPPRKSSKQRPRRKAARSYSPRIVSSSVSSGCRCRATLDSVWISKSDSPLEFSSSSPFDSSPDPDFRTDSVLAPESNSYGNDIIIDVDKESLKSKFHKIEGGFDCLSKLEIELPPINTKPPPTFNDMLSHIREKETTKKSAAKKISSPGIKFSVNSAGVRLKINSPRIGNKRINNNQANGRKSVSSSSTRSSGSRRSMTESLAIVKSSYDPQRDFRESMVEMIVENNIKESKDLEDLLACYLSLNADEYHELIIKVFKQIWFDLSTHTSLLK